jgi:hypothetical protein
MTARERLLRVCQRNRILASENLRLRTEVCRLEAECSELCDANANIRTERDVTDTLLGEAMDELLDRARK